MNNYCEHLYDESTDGYIQIAQIDKGNISKIKNTYIDCLREITEEFKAEEDVYITPNTTYIPIRRVENIRQFRALFLDFDNIKDDKHYVAYNIFEMVEEGKIPAPTMIVDSGGGLHVYWKIKNAPYAALYSWQEIEDMLYHRLRHLGADKQATDAARILRLPNTINSKNFNECRVLYINQELEHSMYDIKEQYIKIKKKKQTIKSSQKVVTNALFNSYSLHMDRATDMLTLCKLRDYKVTGYRNMILHCYAYWIGIYARNEEELANNVNDLNSSFIEPVEQSHVEAVLRCIPKAIDKFIAYEQGIRNGEDKRVTKGMKDKAGYWYKNETLIERLNITEEEQTHLKTIIGTRVKYDRKNAIRTPRNENGLTKREQQKQDTIKSIRELKDKGLNNTQIAKKLEISRVYVSKVINNRV